MKSAGPALTQGWCSKEESRNKNGFSRKGNGRLKDKKDTRIATKVGRHRGKQQLERPDTIGDDQPVEGVVQGPGTGSPGEGTTKVEEMRRSGFEKTQTREQCWGRSVSVLRASQAKKAKFARKKWRRRNVSENDEHVMEVSILNGGGRSGMSDLELLEQLFAGGGSGELTTERTK